MIKNIAIITILVAVAGLPEAHARSVFLNGVDISAVRNQTFKKTTVHIDNKGNIRIDAPGYNVEVQEPTQAAKPKADKGGPNPSLSKRFYLVTQPSASGRAQYDVTFSVNGTERIVIKAGTPQVIMEISVWMHRGENEIVIEAKKNLSGGRKSSSPSDEAKIMVGRGHEENKIVKIDSIKAKVTVKASDLSNVKKHFVIVAN